MKEKIVGILGGMGPEATNEVYKRIIKLTDAKNDFEHLRVIIDSNSKIPDRTNAIMNKGESPVEEMIKTALNIQNSGADFIIIPCITAHYFIDDIKDYINIPILNGLELTQKYIYEKHSNINRIGIIATTGTISTNLFQKHLGNDKLVIPSGALQDEIMDIIYGEDGIKAGNTNRDIIIRIKNVINTLIEREGIDCVIAGCTEIGVVTKQSDVELPLIDPLTVLAECAVKIGKGLNY